MNHEQLQREILTCLPSNPLRERIQTLNYNFTEKELLGIAFHYAPSFDERLRLLQLLVDHAPDVSDHAASVIEWQKSCLERFRQHSEEEIYELHIKCRPDAYEERYLCSTFETALEMIDGFYKEYDEKEEPFASYEIVKRKILHTAEPFREDWQGECTFSAGKTLVSIYRGFDEDREFGQCSSECEECLHPCAASIQVSFPVVVADRAPVRYYESGRYPQYGIQLNFECLETLPEYYVIPFDGYTMQNGDYDDFWDHKHIPSPNVEEISVEELSPEFRKRYESFAAWLKDHYTENYERIRDDSGEKMV